MAFSVQMPALGESVTEGRVTRWLKQEGDAVEVDEPLLEVSTDKVDTEIPSPAAGVLTRIVAQEDDTVEVGGELAVIGEAGQGGADSGAPVEKEEPDSQELAARAEPEPASEPKPVSKPEAPAAQASDGSSTPVLMPELGESVIEGTVTRWLKKVGDPVEVDEPLLEVSTDKVDTEIPSPVAGTLLSITAAEDDTVAVGGELAKIGEQGAAAAEQPAPKPEAEPVPQPKPEPKAEPAPEPKPALTPEPKPAPEPQPAAAPAASAPSADSGPFVTPLVRKLANEKNIDLATVKATGVGGRIRKQDVLAAADGRRLPNQPRRLPPPRDRRHAKRPVRRRRSRTCVAPPRRPTGSGSSPRRRPANPFRRPRNSPRPTKST